MKIKPINAGLLPLLASIGLKEFQKFPTDIFSPISTEYYELFILGLIGVTGVFYLVSVFVKGFREYWGERAPLAAAAVLLVVVWDYYTSKTARLPMPYFPGPERVINVFIEDTETLTRSALSSLKLIVGGFLLGSLAGIVCGSLLGWSKRAAYWLSPVVRILGPVPATAWIPVCLLVFPNAFTASVFLVSLAVWFPVTLMTASAIYNVPKAYYEAAALLGTSQRGQFFRVAVPHALPTIFVGQFMGVGASFLVLITAEMVGASSGLGWYIVWAIGWAAYAKVYATLIISAVIFSGFIKLLFLFRDKLMGWQPSFVKW
ncbi:ABC transporter permease [Seleniivibrio woodruffii]|uniref:ABC transporter permease n=1 Tax=Seleniivibrio woodruffii TaxID=1078050 RepID=UPI0024096023|nr:ABC transporter permease subunit [Seleniivibrio woodruffii]